MVVISQGFRDQLRGGKVQRWDPRPDLVEDHGLVELVLQTAKDLRQDRCFQFLEWFRRDGLRIELMPNGNLRPIFDATGTEFGDGRDGFVPHFLDPSKGEATPARELHVSLVAVLRKARERLAAPGSAGA